MGKERKKAFMCNQILISHERKRERTLFNRSFHARINNRSYKHTVAPSVVMERDGQKSPTLIRGNKNKADEGENNVLKRQNTTNDPL